MLWGIDLEQWSQSDHSQLRTLLWKMTYTDPGQRLSTGLGHPLNAESEPVFAYVLKCLSCHRGAGLMLGRRKLKFTWQVAIRFASILTTAFVFVFQVTDPSRPSHVLHSDG